MGLNDGKKLEIKYLIILYSVYIYKYDKSAIGIGIGTIDKLYT